MAAAAQTDSPPKAPSQDDDGIRFRDALLFVGGAVVAPLVILALMVGGAVVSFAISQVCTPPTAAELEQQRTFLTSHLPDAADVEVGTRDCDDDGNGFIDFSLSSSPATAARRFLSDPVCMEEDDADVDPGDAAVECRTSGFVAYIDFETSRSELTNGTLDMVRD